jgi:hypothetical protein
MLQGSWYENLASGIERQLATQTALEPGLQVQDVAPKLRTNVLALEPHTGIRNRSSRGGALDANEALWIHLGLGGYGALRAGRGRRERPRIPDGLEGLRCGLLQDPFSGGRDEVSPMWQQPDEPQKYQDRKRQDDEDRSSGRAGESGSWWWTLPRSIHESSGATWCTSM